MPRCRNRKCGNRSDCGGFICERAGAGGIGPPTCAPIVAIFEIVMSSGCATNIMTKLEPGKWATRRRSSILSCASFQTRPVSFQRNARRFYDGRGLDVVAQRKELETHNKAPSIPPVSASVFLSIQPWSRSMPRLSLASKMVRAAYRQIGECICGKDRKGRAGKLRAAARAASESHLQVNLRVIGIN